MFILILAVLSHGDNALAHGLGASFEQDVGDVHVDIGYDPAIVAGGDRLVLDLGIYTKETKAPIDFDYVWMRYELNGRLIFATGVAHASLGPTTLLYVLPEDAEGTLEISARFYDGETEQADVSFEIPIARGADAPYPWYLVAGSGGALGVCVVLIGSALYFLHKRRKLA